MLPAASFLLLPALLACVLLLLAVRVPAAAAASTARTYYLVASNGTAVPGTGVTTNSRAGSDVTVTTSGSTYGRTLLDTVNGNNRTRWILDTNGYTGTVLMGWAVLGSNYAQATAIEANATGAFGMRNSGVRTWRFELVDLDTSTGVFTVISAADVSVPDNTSTFTQNVSWANPRIVLSAGHRLGVRIYVVNPAGGTQRVYFNNTGSESSRISVTETAPVDTNPPSTSLSTSPVAPDGDNGWFRSPVSVTLTATDPDGSAVTTYYDWNTNPPASLYAGTFTAPSGTSTLYYRSVDVYGNQEPVQSQAFKVDAAITAPTLTTPTGSAADPPGVRGAVNLEATAADGVSGVAYVAFYVFEWTGSGWAAVGTQVGSNQAVPVSGSTYREVWDTLLVPDNDYKVQAQLRDVAGNTAWSAPQYVRVDNTGPTTALTAPSAGATIRGAAYAVTGTATDPNLTAWTLELRALPAGAWTTLATGSAPVAAGTLYTLDTTAYSDGSYELRLTATDTGGNVSQALLTPVAFDNTKPQVVSALAVSATQVDVLFSEALVPTSVEASYFTIGGLTVGGAALLPDNRTVRLTTSVQTVAAPYTVTVKVDTPTLTDLAGNALGTPNSAGFAGYDITADATPPLTPSGLRAFAGHGRNRLSWQAVTAADLAGYNIYRDTSPTGPFATKVNSGLVTSTSYDDGGYGASGIYYYKVSAVDAVGNESPLSDPVDTHLVAIDQTVPPTGTTLTAANGDIEIAVPAGAVAEPFPLTVIEGAQPADTAALKFVSPAFTFAPAGRSFAANLSITVKYSPSGVNESEIKLFYDDGNGWKAVEGGSAVDATADTVTGQVAHFTVFAAAASDTTPPAVSSVNPVNGATGVGVDSFVTIVFSEPMDPNTLINGNLEIRVGATPIPLETVVFSNDRTTVYLYPDRMLDISTTYTVFIDGSKVTDLAGNPLGADYTSTFTTSATGVSPHQTYSTATNLCRNCHVVHGASGPKLFTEASEKQVCYTCHDGTGSSYNVKTADNTSPYSWDFAEATIGNTSKVSYHPVPKATGLGTGVTMLCSNCHNAHALAGTGPRFLAVKKLDPSYSGAYGAKTGNDFCWTCHNTTAATSAGYISTASWNASTGYDHKTYYPTTDAGHNKSSGAIVMAANPRVPAKQSIACKGCHSEHGTANSKLIAEQVNGAAATFDATSDTQINATYNTFCRNCHATSGLGGPYWPGNAASGTSYINSGHGKSTKTRSIAYSPPVPAVNQNLYVGVCKQCHNPHGTQYANYTLDFEENLCYACHDADGPGRLLGPGNFSIQRQFTTGNAPGSSPAFLVAYNRSTAGAAVPLSRHPVLDSEQGQTYSVTKRGTGGGTAAASTGAIECLNCHNPHLNGDTSPASLYWKVLDADVQPGQAGYPTALRDYKTTNTLVVGGVTRSYNAAAGDYNPDHPLGTHPSQPYNPASGSAESTADSIKFCLACHDNTVPAGTSPSVSMGTAPMDIASRWLGNPGLAHGNGRGNYLNKNDQRPRYPFQSATYSNNPPAQAYAAIQCTTCHDPHGSKNVYFLREYIVVDGIVMNNSNTYLNGAPINLPVWPVDASGRLYNDFFGQFCATCHSSGRFANHEGGLGNTPTTSVNCDNEHRWSRYQGGTDGLHDNANARGDKKSW